MKTIANEIRAVIHSAAEQLVLMDADKVAHKENPQSWSKKEILGHLIDSAANNHQRFVRTCYNASEQYPPYSQNDWIEIQHYNELDWSDLIDLWAVYNRHLSCVIERLPQQALTTSLRIGQAEPVTLEFVVKDYLRHLQHHLKDLLA